MELIFLAILALLVFGPRKLPEVARTVAKVMAELRRASNEFRYSLEEEVRALDLKELQDRTEGRRLELAPPPPPPAASEATEAISATGHEVVSPVEAAAGVSGSVPRPRESVQPEPAPASSATSVPEPSRHSA